jgi:hypothetical protein
MEQPTSQTEITKEKLTQILDKLEINQLDLKRSSNFLHAYCQYNEELINELRKELESL